MCATTILMTAGTLIALFVSFSALRPLPGQDPIYA